MLFKCFFPFTWIWFASLWEMFDSISLKCETLYSLIATHLSIIIIMKIVCFKFKLMKLLPGTLLAHSLLNEEVKLYLQLYQIIINKDLTRHWNVWRITNDFVRNLSSFTIESDIVLVVQLFPLSKNKNAKKRIHFRSNLHLEKYFYWWSWKVAGKFFLS